MNINEMIAQGKSVLKEKGFEDFAIIANVLAGYILELPKVEMIANSELEVSEEIERSYFSNINKIIEGVPLQYITNSQEFFCLDFYVNESVLIPQPDTEILVEEALKLAEESDKVLDMCCGSRMYRCFDRKEFREYGSNFR